MQQSSSFLPLGTHYENFISNQIASGRYNSVAEVITTALRLLEAEENKKQYLNDALAIGEQSGFDDTFNPDDYLKHLNSKFL